MKPGQNIKNVDWEAAAMDGDASIDDVSCDTSKVGTVEGMSQDEELTVAPGSEPGASLFRARRAAGLSLDAVADDLCIRRCYLDALEWNRVADLPDGVFATGFFRSYADSLGVETSALLPAFRRLFGQEETTLAVPSASLSAGSVLSSVQPGRSNGLMPALLGLLGVFVAWGAYAALQTPQLDRSMDAAPAMLTAQKDTQSKPANASATTVARTLSVFPAVHADKKPAVSVAGILATSDVWLSLSSAEGSLIWEGVLPAGDTFDLDGQDTVLVTASDAGALKLVQGMDSDGAAPQSRILGNRGMILNDTPVSVQVIAPRFSALRSVDDSGIALD